jgi:hypothetical protein
MLKQVCKKQLLGQKIQGKGSRNGKKPTLIMGYGIES